MATKEWKFINPMENISAPKVRKKEMKYYEAEEAQKCIQELYVREPIHWRLYFLAAMIGGLRRGEAIALEWDKDVDFEEGGFQVRKNIPKTVNGEAHIKETKTIGSTRFVAMPDWYMDELKEYQMIWKREKFRLGDAWEGGDKQYVFHGGTGKPFYYTTPTYRWSKFAKKIDLKYIRLHDLRHTMVTLLIEEGARFSISKKEVDIQVKKF
ncbi:site-specific integrase [Bacillus gobiensis]|uniref:site-specific integrase n=1 Tax=Bacillus gobiensis TaxID=1441095 RepID=UPI003D1CA3AC